MKISEIKYSRCDIDKVKAALSDILEQIKRAESGDELIDLRNKIIDITVDTQTTISLSYIRYTLNTSESSM